MESLAPSDMVHVTTHIKCTDLKMKRAPKDNKMVITSTECSKVESQTNVTPGEEEVMGEEDILFPQVPGDKYIECLIARGK